MYASANWNQMKKFEWWDVIHEVGYVCGILSSFEDRKKLEHVRDWCQYRLDHDFPENPDNYKIYLNDRNKENKGCDACLACGGYHGNLPCPKTIVTCKAEQ